EGGAVPLQPVAQDRLFAGRAEPALEPDPAGWLLVRRDRWVEDLTGVGQMDDPAVRQTIERDRLAAGRTGADSVAADDEARTVVHAAHRVNDQAVRGRPAHQL